MALHCPATIVVASTPRDERERQALLESLTGDRVLSVVGPPGATGARRFAAALDVPLEEEPGLAGAEPSSALLGEIADLHRGETVLVLTGAAGGAGAVEIAWIEVGDD